MFDGRAERYERPSRPSRPERNYSLFMAALFTFNSIAFGFMTWAFLGVDNPKMASASLILCGLCGLAALVWFVMLYGEWRFPLFLDTDD